MPGCKPKFQGPGGDENAGIYRVVGWILAAAAAGGLLGYLNAADIGGSTLEELEVIGLAALDAAVLAFFVGWAVDWFDRLHPQNPSTITLAGCVLCAGKNSCLNVWTCDGDWTFNLGGPSLTLLAPLDAGLTVDEIRTRGAPGDGPAFPIVDSGAGQPALHCEISSHIGESFAAGGAIGSIAGAIAGGILGAILCGIVGAATFGLGALICFLLLVGAGILAGGLAGEWLGALAGYIADKLSDFDERGEAIHRGCLMMFSGRWVTDDGHQHNEIHDIESAQLIECNQCDTASTESSVGLMAAVGVGRHPTGPDP